MNDSETVYADLRVLRTFNLTNAAITWMAVILSVLVVFVILI